MRRIALLADIHGNLPALEVVVADIERRGISEVVNLGDHVSGPLWPAETLGFLMQQPWLQIAGNGDRGVAQQPPSTHGASDRYAYERLDAVQLVWLGQLAASAAIQVGQATILLCHGTPTSDEEYLLETVAHGIAQLASVALIRQRLADATAAIVLCGHTHIPRVVSVGETLVINPGSVGLPAYSHNLPEPHLMETGSPATRYGILEHDGATWRVELVALPYDHQRAAQHAAAAGRPDWAQALASGYVRE